MPPFFSLITCPTSKLVFEINAFLQHCSINLILRIDETVINNVIISTKQKKVSEIDIPKLSLIEELEQKKLDIELKMKEEILKQQKAEEDIQRLKLEEEQKRLEEEQKRLEEEKKKEKEETKKKKQRRGIFTSSYHISLTQIRQQEV